MIVFKEGVQQSHRWLWKKAKPGEFVTFNSPGTSGMKIFDNNGEEIVKLSLGHEKNRLTFDGDKESNIYLVAIIEDFSIFTDGVYSYEIDVESLVDDLLVQESGELEIISEQL